MKNGYFLFNPISGTSFSSETLEQLQQQLDVQLTALDVTQIQNYQELFDKLESEDLLIIAGGDGTLNRFANLTDGMTYPCEVLYYPCGTGNDFARDMEQEPKCKPFPINQQLQNLPTVEIKGQKYRFINGIGFGIDGYCCEIGDEMRKIPGKKVDYTAIAIRGLLMDYVPTNVTVTVDGERYEYKKVWLAPTMLGRFYGGGMIPCPQQRREQDNLSVMVFQGTGKLRSLMIFPSIFQGKHVKHSKNIHVHAGKEISVTFDQPRPLQVDGETILNVTSYTARR